MARPPILTLTNATLGLGQELLFNDLSLSISDGDRLCLVGRNGCGKSTLMRVIAAEIELDSGSRFLKPGNTVGYMEQDPDLSGFETLGDYATDMIEPFELYKVEMAAEGLKLALDTPVEKASGGERRRAALARLLAMAPDLMLLDEPTNHLDIEAIAWLEAHLKTCKEAYVVISHDRAFLRNLTQGIIWIDRGKARQKNSRFDGFEEWRDEVFAQEDLDRHKLDRLIKSEARWAVEGISGRRKRNMGRVRRLQEMRQERSEQIMRSGTAALQIDSGQKSGKMVIEARGIAKSFGDREIVKPFDLKVLRKDRVAFVGPNGAGKTTLLNLLTDRLEPDAGSLRLGTKIEMAVFDQNRMEVPRDVTLWDALTQDKELGVSGKNDQIMVRGQPRHVVSYLKDFLFSEGQARAPVSALSGGELARLLLARIMAKPSNLLILDEPTNDLDVETLDLLQEILDDYDGTVLLVSHDRDFLDRVATTTIAYDSPGNWVVYAGGWSDYQAQLGAVSKADKQISAPKKKSAPKPEKVQVSKPKISFAEQHRLDELPEEIDRLNAEVAKLEEFLAQPDLFTKEPIKFKKGTEALVERQEAIAAAEEEWMALLEKSEG